MTSPEIDEGPMIYKVSHDSGPTGGGQKITIEGQILLATQYVHFGDTAVQPDTTPTQESVQCTTPPHHAAFVYLWVSNGAASNKLNYQYVNERT